MDRCPFCTERRRNAAGKPRRSLRYTPLIPQLQGLFENADSIKRMLYRSKAEAEDEPGTYADTFDGPTTERFGELWFKRVATTGSLMSLPMLRPRWRRMNLPCSRGAAADSRRRGQSSS